MMLLFGAASKEGATMMEATKLKRRIKNKLLSGPPAMFRGKDREKVITFTMTPEGHAALARLVASRDGVSRADVLEEIIRNAAARR